MTQLPVKRHAGDASSADDMRKIGPAAMVIAAALAVLVMMAVVNLPRMWGIDRFGPDLTRGASTSHAGASH